MWHGKLLDDLRNMSFLPCKAKLDTWMRQCSGLWYYITLYVDDPTFVVRDPKTISDLLEEKCKYKLKVTGIISYHLGCDFFRDDEEVICMAPKKYIEKIIGGYKNMLNKKP